MDYKKDTFGLVSKIVGRGEGPTKLRMRKKKEAVTDGHQNKVREKTATVLWTGGIRKGEDTAEAKKKHQQRTQDKGLEPKPQFLFSGTKGLRHERKKCSRLGKKLIG